MCRGWWQENRAAAIGSARGNQRTVNLHFHMQVVVVIVGHPTVISAPENDHSKLPRKLATGQIKAMHRARRKRNFLRKSASLQQSSMEKTKLNYRERCDRAGTIRKRLTVFSPWSLLFADWLFDCAFLVRGRLFRQNDVSTLCPPANRWCECHLPFTIQVARWSEVVHFCQFLQPIPISMQCNVHSVQSAIADGLIALVNCQLYDFFAILQAETTNLPLQVSSKFKGQSDVYAIIFSSSAVCAGARGTIGPSSSQNILKGLFFISAWIARQ